jgi:hypothetical protein
VTKSFEKPIVAGIAGVGGFNALPVGLKVIGLN